MSEEDIHVSQQSLILREVRASDRPGIISLISNVYQEYGERICLEDADSDLLSLPDSYLCRDGTFFVLTSPEDAIVGSHAFLPNAYGPGVATFRRLYLIPRLRGSKWGTVLMQATIDLAIAAKQDRIEFWSDTRFHRAHAFFGKFGFCTENETRTMTDGFEPYHEYKFYLDLSVPGTLSIA